MIQWNDNNPEQYGTGMGTLTLLRVLTAANRMVGLADVKNICNTVQI